MTQQPFTGGYYLLDESLMRGGLHAHTSADPDAVSERVLDGVNLIQNTAWRINTTILDLMREAWVAGLDLGESLPPSENEPLPQHYPDAVWETMTKAERADHLFQRSQVHARNAKLQGKREAFLRKLEVAELMREEPAIWFPHFLDFRGRIYPLPQDLTPQSDDVAKGLLMFAEGKPLGDRGVYWLAIRLANTFGKDKLSFDERVAWVYANEDAILQCAANPFDHGRYWMEADEPWCFLATCLEWSLMKDEKVPSEFISHLPIPLDGTCNGVQHLSLMGRDKVGALATNCRNVNERHDLYQTVADEVNRLVAADAVDGNEQAHWWIENGVTRATVKRAVMTTPYGVTARGIRDQLIKDGFVAKTETKAADYLQTKIVEALQSTVSAAKDIMAYFQDVASTLAEHDIPLRWQVPTGLKVTQAYWKVDTKRVRTLMGTMSLTLEDAQMGLSARKQALSSAPNIVHSFDAAMLIETALAANKAFGIESFAFVHDSYGTHAADTDALADTLRFIAVSFYQENQLEKFHEYVRSYVPEHIELPSPPPVGDFDVSEVQDAPYFFA